MTKTKITPPQRFSKPAHFTDDGISGNRFDQAAGDMELAGDEYVEPADRCICRGQSGLYRQSGRLQPAYH